MAGLLRCEWVNRVGLVQSVSRVGFPVCLHRLHLGKAGNFRMLGSQKDSPGGEARDSGVPDAFGGDFWDTA